MLMANNQYSHLSAERLKEIDELVGNVLVKDWAIRIEYSDDIKSMDTEWRQWGEVMFGISDSSSVIDSIYDCHLNNGKCAMRLNAQRYFPEICFYYCICRPAKPAAT